MGRDDNKDKASFTTQIYFVDGKTYTNQELDAIEKKYNLHFTQAQRDTYRTLGGAPFLDQSYTVFGEIVKGMDFIDKVTAVKVNKDGNPDKKVWMKISVLSDKQVARELKGLFRGSAGAPFSYPARAVRTLTTIDAQHTAR